ncbi:SpaA isopeptide-forming pilin-related protein [Streptomyces bobili]|uniref:SpaA isopeptide-forming pilin-related protein n=1 Tax=Streptomyces bobili TaxID=67280 RepID=UPI0037173A3B
MTGTLALAPAASANTPEPTPSTSSTPLSAAENGGVTILKKDPGGGVLAGATFTLLDSTGKQAASSTTDAEGQLTFQDLPPGVYRLKEVSSGSPQHEVVDDQDVIVTPGADTPLTIIDPFKPASVRLKAKDDKTGKLLAGSTVNIGSGDKTPLTVTVTNAKSATTPLPTEKPTDKPTDKPSDRPTSDKPGQEEDTSTPSASGTSTSDETASNTVAPAPAGSLAHTGAEATPWLIGGAGVLIAVGGGALFAARRRRTDNSTDNGSTES